MILEKGRILHPQWHEWICSGVKISWQPWKHTTMLKILESTLPTEPTISTMIYSHIYSSSNKVHVQMILTDHILVHIRYENNDQVRKLLVPGYQVWSQENDWFLYIPVTMTNVCKYYYLWTYLCIYSGWKQPDDIITISVDFIYHIRQIRNETYKWIQVHTIYNLILNVHLFHIHHKRNGDSFGTYYKIVIFFSETNTPST